jgi:hypothetical protein
MGWDEARSDDANSILSLTQTTHNRTKNKPTFQLALLQAPRFQAGVHDSSLTFLVSIESHQVKHALRCIRAEADGEIAGGCSGGGFAPRK